MTVEHVMWCKMPAKPLRERSTEARGVGMQNKTANEPHAKRGGLLRNGNPPVIPPVPPLCGARTRSSLPYLKCPAKAIKTRISQRKTWIARAPSMRSLNMDRHHPNHRSWLQ
jgi:hypothetical protein